MKGKEFCSLSNLCGDQHCCHYCLKGCEMKCMDDVARCKYLCREDEVPEFLKPVKLKKPVKTDIRIHGLPRRSR